jgi:phosphonate transport system substrate-binding protein
METHTTLILGAVAYDPKVVTIWDGFLAWFRERGFAFDYQLYSNYERQVEAQFLGQCHVAWNSPLAWIQSERLARRLGRTAEAIAMRDTDRDLTSVIVVRTDSKARTLADLRGARVAVGAPDSPQATLIPLLCLAEAGLTPETDIQVLRHDLLVGKHGDHIGGERDAACALRDGRADAACMIDGNHLLFTREGTLPPGSTRVLYQTPAYDHCNFTVLDGAPAESTSRFRSMLLGMSYEDAAVRRLLDLEGLKAWQPGRTEGYELLNRAVDRFGTLDPWLASRQER